MNMQKKFKCGVVYILAFVVFFTNIPMSVQAVEHESMEIDVNNNIWEGNVAKKFASGDGTVSNPYIISNGAELRYFADEITNGENFYNKYIDNLENNKCKVCGGSLYTRDDDKVETYENRYKLFKEKTMPVVEYLSDKYDIYTVSNNGTFDEMKSQIDNIMGN